jgi:hypothetical protein
MISSKGADSYAQAMDRWGSYWQYGPIENLSTGHTWDSGLINVDNDVSEMIVWDGATPQSSPGNAVWPEVVDMSANPVCIGPQISP